MVFDPVNRFIWSMVIFTLFITGFSFLSHAKKKELSKEKVLLIGYSSFFLSVAFHIIFIFLSDYYIEGTYLGHSYHGDLFEDTNPTFYLIKKLAYISILIGYTSFMFTFEKIFKHTKYSLTILNVILVIITILYDPVYFHVIFETIDTLIFFLILIWLYKRSTKEFQGVAVFVLIGYGLIVLGLYLNQKLIRNLNIISPNIPPIFVLIGSILSVSPLFINPVHFRSRPLIYWSIFIFFCTFILIFLINLMLYTEYHIISWTQSIITIILTSFLIVFGITRVIKTLKTSDLERSREEKGDSLDFFGTLSRPQKVTEEEVTISKERKICLVCKGKLGGFMFMCRYCGTFYCDKCTRALIELENACWACDNALDESKPVKLPEKKEEEISIEDKIKTIGEGK